MGMTSDAILVFGVQLGNQLMDTMNPTCIEFMEAHDGYPDSSAIVALIGEDNHGLVFTSHCTDDDPSWVLGIKATYRSASRGFPREVDIETLKVDEETVARLRLAASKLGVTDEPKWWLQSVWSY